MFELLARVIICAVLALIVWSYVQKWRHSQFIQLQKDMVRDAYDRWKDERKYEDDKEVLKEDGDF